MSGGTTYSSQRVSNDCMPVWVRRIKMELKRLKRKPTAGITITPRDDRIDILDVAISGPEETPYEGGLFKLVVTLPESYPFNPPHVKFVTPVYHPNIDNQGNICLDILKSSWRAAMGVEALIVTMKLLLANPNPEHPLMPEIAEQFLFNKDRYISKAKQLTAAHAM